MAFIFIYSPLNAAFSISSIGIDLWISSTLSYNFIIPLYNSSKESSVTSSANALCPSFPKLGSFSSFKVFKIFFLNLGSFNFFSKAALALAYFSTFAAYYSTTSFKSFTIDPSSRILSGTANLIFGFLIFFTVFTEGDLPNTILSIGFTVLTFSIS